MLNYFKPVRLLLLLLFLSVTSNVSCQQITNNNAAVEIYGNWIAPPATNLHQYGVYHFKKIFTLTAKPARFIIHISADQRYRLFVNGRSLATGPSRSDVQHWRYQTVDIADALLQGNNTIAVTVWNDGEQSAWAQLSFQTGLFVQGATDKEAVLNTDTSWSVVENNAYAPVATIAHITGAFEQVFAQRYPWGWQQNKDSNSMWLPAIISEKVPSKTIVSTNPTLRHLTPSQIPMPEERILRLAHIRYAKGTDAGTDDLLKGTGSLNIHPGADVTLLLDQEYLTTAYISLLTSGGKGAKITITYAEALFDSSGAKGNRNEIKNKTIKGNHDVFILDGGDNRLFNTLYYRTYRYIELHIENHQQNLLLQDFYGTFTAYPFKENASFESSDSSLQKIWETGWRTARLCAFETYMDCPYYEQLQYVGDTRIQALVSLYVSGDDRLMRNAIEQLYYSILPGGLTQSRYPSNNQQIIPPFSLFWIGMIHDYWMHKKDDAFVQKFFPAIKKILDWHTAYINKEGMLNKMPYWNFVDWSKEWPWTGKENESGVPAGTTTGNSSILTLQLVMALQKAATLFAGYQNNNTAKTYIALSNSLKNAVYKNCWSSNKHFLADTPDKTSFSQHAQALAVLTSTLPASEEKELLKNTLSNSSLIQCTYYYRFYLLQALKKAGLGDMYLSQLTPWKNMLAIGLTTFAEAPEPSRSDCHAWSASPCYDLLATVCGIEPASAGFSSVRIQPHLGNLTFCDGSMPHPNGIIKVHYKKRAAESWDIRIDLPRGIEGIFVWQGKEMRLKSGINIF
ncbi:MAG: alpha-L-rhamnosidase N-terminal domain-containing protein [Bacteroidota bacterium]